MVLRRLSGRTENTAPVLTLVTQFGGGKTHTLASLYHLANAGSGASGLPGVPGLLSEAGVAQAPAARGRGVRRQCLGPRGRPGDAVDRFGTAVGG